MAVISSNQLNLKETAVYPEHECLYRFIGVLFATIMIVAMCLTAITFRDNVFSAQFDKFMQAIYQVSARHGLNVEDIIVDGNERTSYDELVSALNLSDNESILGIDIAQLQNKIEQLTWVRKCVVKRSFFPNDILVHIEERQVKAIWQNEGRYYPVDAEGNVIEVEDYEPDAPILLLVGENAPQHLSELLAVLHSDEELEKRVKAAVFISKRRWNLIFDHPRQGVVVKLPEENFDKAYKKIALLNKRRGIFKRKLTSFDVRYENRIIVDVDKSVEDLMLKR